MDASGHYVYGEKWHPESSYIQLIGFGELGSCETFRPRNKHSD
jgi:hypothetical protein